MPVYDVGTVGEFGEIGIEKPAVNANGLLELMRAGEDISAMDDKAMLKKLAELDKKN